MSYYISHILINHPDSLKLFKEGYKRRYLMRREGVRNLRMRVLEGRLPFCYKVLWILLKETESDDKVNVSTLI